MDVFEHLAPILKMFWYVAIPTSIIFIIQTIMTFFITDASDGVNADFNGDLTGVETPFQLFSLRNLINFLLGFSWTGISCYNSISNPILLITTAFVVGVLFVYLFFMIIKQIQKLAEDNSFRIESTLNKTADVYLSIPGGKTGKGKIMISIKGSFRELDAMTENDRIPTGATVKVIKIENSEILIVEPI